MSKTFWILLAPSCSWNPTVGIASFQQDLPGTIPLPEALLRALPRESPLAKPDPNDSEKRKLLKERYTASQRGLLLRFQVFQAGARGGTIDGLFEALRRRAHAGLALCDRIEDQITIAEEMVGFAQFISDVNKTRFEVGQIAPQDYESSRYELFDWKIRLLDLKESAAANQNKK